MGYLEGFAVTIRQHRLFGGKQVTTEYSGGRGARRKSKRSKDDESSSATPVAPALDAEVEHDEKAAKPERLHGRHVLNRYEDGMEKCIGCELCAGVCPAKCIYVRGADNDPDAPTAPGERYGFVYEINYLRCIHCDLCVEACPTEAITESKLFEFSFTNRRDAIYTKAELVVDDDGRPQRLPWEDWRTGEDRDTSGWVRATASSGDADFEGIVGWSAELGYGVRPPEPAQHIADQSTRAEGSASDPAREAPATSRTRTSAASESIDEAQSSERVSSEREPAGTGEIRTSRGEGSASDEPKSSERASSERDHQHGSASDEAQSSERVSSEREPAGSGESRTSRGEGSASDEPQSSERVSSERDE